MKHGLNALRIGAPTRVKEDLRKSTIEARFFSHSLYPTLEVLRRDQPSQREKIENLERTIISDIVLVQNANNKTLLPLKMFHYLTNINRMQMSYAQHA